jgi:hypothetical protein
VADRAVAGSVNGGQDDNQPLGRCGEIAFDRADLGVGQGQAAVGAWIGRA